MDTVNCGERLFSLSESQTNIFRLEKARSGTAINNICTALIVDGRYDVPAMQRSLNALLESDSALRLRITVTQDGPMQYCAPYSEERFSYFDFSAGGGAGVEQWMNAAAAGAMQLTDSPLYSFSLFRTGPQSGGVLITLHHIIADGWSVMHLAEKLSAAYLAILEGGEPDMPAATEYSEHVDAERRYRESRAFERDAEYWSETAKKASGRARIKQNGGSPSMVGRRISRPLSDTLCRLIADFGEKNGIAPFSVFQTALLIYLSRITGEKRACIGVPILNRSNVSEKMSGGMFVSTAPFFCELDEEKSFTEQCGSAAEEWFSLLKHSRYPFSRICGSYKESTGDDDIFDIVLSYQENRAFGEHTRLRLSGLWTYSGCQAEKLIVHIEGRDGGYSVCYDYQAQLFTDEEIIRTHARVERMLICALRSPDMPVWQLPVTDEAERELVLYGFNRTNVPQPGMSVAQAFASAADSCPRRAALIYKGERMSYAELKRRALIRASAIKRGSVTAISLGRSFELIECMLGAAFAGSAWLVIPPELPAARKLAILTGSGADTVIADGENAAAFEGAVRTMPSGLPELAEYGGESPGPGELCYIVYTSGSTGKPKGVEIENGSLVNFAHGVRSLYGGRGVLSVCSVGFDAFLLESIAALLNSQTVVLADEANSPSHIAGLITGHGIDTVIMTPSRLLSYMEDASFFSAICTVKSVICGGEPMSAAIAERLWRTDADIYNQYGPSEATVGVCWARARGESTQCVGAPMENCRLYVLDGHMRPQPVGAMGELYIGGVQVARGYRNDPEATAKAFIKNPFETGDRLYRTGDMAMWDARGNILLGGRRDSQIKLRGYRIETDEIACAINGCPGVKLSAVFADGESIAAYYVAERDIPETELVQTCAERLPSYMIPSAFVRVPFIPLTGNGKADRAALPSVKREAGRRPETDAERAIVSVFAEVLGRDIGADDDFFRFGGDSLTAVGAAVRIEQKCGRTVDVRMISQLRTAARLAEQLTGQRRTARPALTHIRRDRYPLTSAQKAMYIAAQMSPESTVYNMPGKLRLSGSTDLKKLEAAFRRLIADEPMLRTAFEADGSGIYQRAADEAPFSLVRLAAENEKAAETMFVKPFELSRPPLLRAAVRETADGLMLFTDIHHIICDGMSTPLLLERLEKYLAGESPVLPCADFPDHVCALAERSTGAHDYWARALADCPPPPDLPFDSEGSGDFTGGTYCFDAGAELSEKIAEVCRERGATRFSVLAGAYALLIARITRTDDVVIGVPFSGRTEAETMRAIGPFINTLPLRVHIGEKTRTLLEDISRDVACAADDQFISHEELSGFAGRSGELFDVLFTEDPPGCGELTIAGTKTELIPIRTDASKLSLSMRAFVRDSVISFALEYSSRFEKSTAELYSRSYLQVLRELIEKEYTDEVRGISPRDMLMLIERPSGIRLPFEDARIDALADAYAELCPDAPAIVYGGTVITFAGLKQSSDGVAAQLKSMGACGGGVVACCMRRTPGLIFTVFGIMKTGAAYMALDPELPAARMAEYVERAGCRLIVADGYGAQRARDTGVKVAMLTDADGQNAHERSDGANVRSAVIAESAANAAGSAEAVSAAQIIFTSGSTGRPKGAAIAHRSIASLTGILTRFYDASGVDGGVLFSSSVLFDSFTVEVLVPLASGRSVIIADETQMTEPGLLGELIESAGAKLIFSTPSRLKVYMRDEAFRRALSGVKMIMCGGEVLTRSLAGELCAACGGAIYNMYGPVETTAFVTAERVRPDRTPTIGRPVPNSGVYILDEKNRPVLPTAEGELCISGEGLAIGYINDKELTEKSFINAAPRTGARIYKTGDMARQKSDGSIVFTGRRDGQVKLNGQRIETEEITSAIMSTGLVSDAAVMLADGALRAFVSDCEDTSALREALKNILPAYMRPSEFIPTAKIPYTPSGKTDSTALAALRSVRAVNADGGGTVREVWREALGHEPDADASFFEQGGTSLMAMDAIIKYFKRDIRLTLAQFYANPHMSEQEKLISQAANIADKEEVSAKEEPAAKHGKEDAVFVTGGTGFLGAHLIAELAKRRSGRIYCLVRGEGRIAETLGYYFGAERAARLMQRVTEVGGDITLPCLGMDAEICERIGSECAEVWHAAADVRHYTERGASERVNLTGTQHAADMCRDWGAELKYISTVSVSGSRAPEGAVFDESCADIGQNWQDNVYVRSKFMAEKYIAASRANGLKATVFRVGRLVGRSTDGMFQRNPASNYFWLLIRGIEKIGCIPESLEQMPVELTAVDLCARALVALSKNVENVYHVYNPHKLALSDALADAGIAAEAVPEREFLRRLSASESSAETAALAETFNAGPVGVEVSADMTTEALAKSGFAFGSPDASVLLADFVRRGGSK